MAKIETFITKIEGYFICALISAMVLLSFIEVILRNFFYTGFPWSGIFLRQSVLWFALIGASMAASQNKHIKLDILQRVLPERFAKPTQIIVYLFSCAICLFLVWASWQFVVSEKSFGTTIYAHIPAWSFQVILPAGFLLLALKFFFRFLENLSLGRRS